MQTCYISLFSESNVVSTKTDRRLIVVAEKSPEVQSYIKKSIEHCTGCRPQSVNKIHV